IQESCENLWLFLAGLMLLTNKINHFKNTFADIQSVSSADSTLVGRCKRRVVSHRYKSILDSRVTIAICSNSEVLVVDLTEKFRRREEAKKRVSGATKIKSGSEIEEKSIFLCLKTRPNYMCVYIYIYFGLLYTRKCFFLIRRTFHIANTFRIHFSNYVEFKKKNF
ncbi:hypothetical protein L9F63_013484, partial [Diploptera punctata]